MIGSLFNALTGRVNYSAHGHKINTAAGSKAIQMQLNRAGQQNAAQQYSLAAGARGTGGAMAVREAQRRAQLGMMAAGDQAAQSELQLQQGVAEANQRAAMQAEDINARIAEQNAGGLGKLAGAVVGGAALAMSDEQAKMGIRPMAAHAGMIEQQPRELGLLERGQYGQATGMPDDGRRVIMVQSAPPPVSNEGFEYAPRVTTPVKTMGGPYHAPTAGITHRDKKPGLLEGIGMGMMSDARSKQKIAELQAANRGLINMLARKQPAPAGGGTGAAPPMPAPAPAPAAPAYDVASVPRPGVVRVQSSTPIPPVEQDALDIEQAMSDQRSKQYLSDEQAKGATSYLRPVRPVSYEYKPEILARGEGDPGPQYGLLAQDLARTPQGASVVERGQDGLLRVQTPQLLMLNTAADAEQQAEIERLKRRMRIG